MTTTIPADGSVAVGAGGDLCSARAMAAGVGDAITSTAHRFSTAALRVRERHG